MNLLKSTGTFGFYTIISRLLGYLRDILIAIFLGTGMLADAFFVAFRIPNTFRRLFAEGTFNAAFVPSYSSEITKGKKQSNKFANDIFNLLFLGLLFLTIISKTCLLISVKPNLLDLQISSTLCIEAFNSDVDFDFICMPYSTIIKLTLKQYNICYVITLQ